MCRMKLQKNRRPRKRSSASGRFAGARSYRCTQTPGPLLYSVEPAAAAGVVAAGSGGGAGPSEAGGGGGGGGGSSTAREWHSLEVDVLSFRIVEGKPETGTIRYVRLVLGWSTKPVVLGRY